MDKKQNKKVKKKAVRRSKILSTSEASKIVGLPLEVMVRMRSRETTTLKSGPPYRKTTDKDGNVIYQYEEKELKKWLEKKNHKTHITAKDAAETLGISRDEIVGQHGLHRYELLDGDLLVYPLKNMFIWIGRSEKK